MIFYECFTLLQIALRWGPTGVWVLTVFAVFFHRGRPIAQNKYSRKRNFNFLSKHAKTHFFIFFLKKSDFKKTHVVWCGHCLKKGLHDLCETVRKFEQRMVRIKVFMKRNIGTLLCSKYRLKHIMVCKCNHSIFVYSVDIAYGAM